MCHSCGSRNPGFVSGTEILGGKRDQGKVNASFFLDSHFRGNDTLGLSPRGWGEKQAAAL